MDSKLSKKLEEEVENICGLGCTHVNQIIDNAKKGDEIKELADFNGNEVEQIINELSKIMSVYDE